MQYFMYFRFRDDVMFSHNGANGPESKMARVSSSSPAGGAGRSLPSPTASGFFMLAAIFS